MKQETLQTDPNTETLANPFNNKENISQNPQTLSPEQESMNLPIQVNRVNKFECWRLQKFYLYHSQLFAGK
jgi:hypothetical protein